MMKESTEIAKHLLKVSLTVGIILQAAAPALANPIVKNDCPEVGAEVPFAQLIAQADLLEDCDVTTEANFVAVGRGNDTLMMFDFPEQTIFQVTPPGQALVPTAMGGVNTSFVSIPNPEATSIFSAATGDRLIMGGRMEYRRLRGGLDGGASSRVFRAEWIRPAAVNHSQ